MIWVVFPYFWKHPYQLISMGLNILRPSDCLCWAASIASNNRLAFQIDQSWTMEGGHLNWLQQRSASKKTHIVFQLQLEVVFLKNNLMNSVWYQMCDWKVPTSCHHLDLAFTTSTHSPFGPFAKRVKYCRSCQAKPPSRRWEQDTRWYNLIQPESISLHKS